MMMMMMGTRTPPRASYLSHIQFSEGTVINILNLCNRNEDELMKEILMARQTPVMIINYFSSSLVGMRCEQDQSYVRDSSLNMQPV